MKEILTSSGSSAIRKMFEEGIELKKIHGEDNVFDFSLGNPDLDPPQEVVSAIKEVAEDTSHGAHGYMPNAGYAEAREAMAKKVSQEQNLEVPPQNIVMTAGAASALNCVLKSILDSGDEIVVPAPFFAEYRNYVKNYGGVLLEAKTNDDFSLNTDEIASKLSPKTAAVLINSPNNPTGRIYRKEEIEKLSSVLKNHAKKTGRTPLLICDEPYRAINYGNEVASVFQFYDSAVIVTSFAKDISIPGERVGFAAVSPKCEESAFLVSAITFSLRVLGFVNSNAFFQKVVSKSWNAKVDYSSYQKRRDILTGILDKAGIAYAKPEGAFYLFCRVPSEIGDDGKFTEILKKHLILAAPGSGFGGKGWFRLAYCVSEKTIIKSERAFLDVMAEIKK